MANVFSIQFDVMPKKAETASVVFDALHKEVVNWIVGNYHWRWKTNCKFPAHSETLTPLPKHLLHAMMFQVANGGLERVHWVHPADQDESLSWSTDIAIGRLADRVQFALQLSVTSVSYVVRPAWIPLGRPRLVTQVLKQFSCWVGPQPLPASKQEILAPDVDAFVQESLLNEKRTLPIVVVSHDRFGDRPLVDAERIQQTLLGFAQVVVIDKWAAFRLTDLITKPLSCYNGAARVYWPGLRLSSNPLDHPLYLPDALQKHEFSKKPIDKHLFDFLAKVSSFRYVEGDVIRDVQHELDSTRTMEIEKQKLQLQKGLTDAATVQELKSESERLYKELERSWDEAKDLRTRGTELEADNKRLKENWALYREYQDAIREAEPQTADEIPDSEYNSVAEALNAAERDFEGDLLVYESARKSSGESDFARPKEVYRALMAIRDIGNLYFDAARKGPSMGSWEAQFKKRGFPQYRPDESQTTKTKYGKERKFTHNGKTKAIYRHLDLGGGDRKNCLQFYFEPDQVAKQMIIAYCGVHLHFAQQGT